MPGPGERDPNGALARIDEIPDPPTPGDFVLHCSKPRSVDSTPFNR